MASSRSTATSPFRDHLPDLSSERFRVSKAQDPYSYTEAFNTRHHPPWLYDLTQAWEKLLAQPYHGLTSDGHIRTGLFKRQNEEVPTQDVVAAAESLLHQLTPAQKNNVSYDVNAREWRAWSNPEFLLRAFGLRLEEVPESIANSILAIIEKSFSPEGYHKALTAMRTNHFLGELCEVPKIMNQYSYNFLIFGTPSATSAWGWSLYGHHLCLNTFFIGSQIVISPTFTGAEPNRIDKGPWAGTELLNKEGELGLKLMQSLPASSQEKAQIFKQLKDSNMNLTGNLVTDRWNQDDQRMLCGAFRDNRIVPCEGITAISFNQAQKDLLLDIIHEFILYLPETARQKRLDLIRDHSDETYFCWIGDYDDEAAFYYRIQSPVIVCEFDHHSGVFLTNQVPARFHTHTIVRTPNGGDYGNALRDDADKVT